LEGLETEYAIAAKGSGIDSVSNPIRNAGGKPIMLSLMIRSSIKSEQHKSRNVVERIGNRSKHGAQGWRAQPAWVKQVLVPNRIPAQYGCPKVMREAA
jgi:hypothetical protein